MAIFIHLNYWKIKLLDPHTLLFVAQMQCEMILLILDCRCVKVMALIMTENNVPRHLMRLAEKQTAITTTPVVRAVF